MIDYNKVLCPAIKEMKPSGIRKFFDIAQQLEGVISLGVGEPDSRPRADTSGSYLNFGKRQDLLYRKRRSNRSP